MSFLSSVLGILRVPGVQLLRLFLGAVLVHSPYDVGRQQRPLVEAYDFIVVGGGVGGSVVAGRLASTGATVLVLEAGGSAPPETSVPSLFPLFLGGDLDWNIPLKSQKNYFWGFNNNASLLALGKTLGGGSTISAMVYARGTKFEYDQWARLGNEGWDYESVLPYFKKVEDFAGKTTEETARYHNTGGPFRVSPVPTQTGVSRAFLEAGTELGYDIIDENAQGSIGFTPMQFALRNGRRETASEAYLRPGSTKDNLTVKTNSLVTKIVFDSNRRAVGVEYKRGKRTVTLRANKEVILCAGAINTPKLLMLSGVGPAQHLRDLRIPLVAELEGVGRNLQDHPVVLQIPFGVNEGNSLAMLRRYSLGSFKEYFKSTTGPLSLPFGEDGFAWVNLAGDGDPLWPDVQITQFNFVFNVLNGLPLSIFQNMRKEVLQDLLSSVEGQEATNIGCVLTRPKSRGTVMLASNNPSDNPIVDHNFYSHPDDMKLMVKGIRFALKVGRTDAYKKIGAKYASKRLRGCVHHDEDSDEYWECLARHVTNSFYHVVGTCKMAPLSDPMGVVDPATLKVRGVSALRIVDASIMPVISAANTATPVLMIGERGAQMISTEWGLL